MKTYTSLLFLVLAIALFFWYINPTYGEIGTLRSEVDNYKVALGRAERAVDTKNTLLAQYNTIKPNEQRLKTLLPDYVDTIRLIIDINSIANRYNASIKNIQLKDAPQPTKQAAVGIDNRAFGTVQIGFTISLSYDQYLSFVSDLEKSLPILDVSSLSFKAGNASNVYDYSISLNTYWLK